MQHIVMMSAFPAPNAWLVFRSFFFFNIPVSSDVNSSNQCLSSQEWGEGGGGEGRQIPREAESALIGPHLYNKPQCSAYWNQFPVVMLQYVLIGSLCVGGGRRWGCVGEGGGR